MSLSSQEAFLASWRPALQSRAWSVTGGRFESERAWAEAGNVLG